jgi:hypothetical protein
MTPGAFIDILMGDAGSTRSKSLNQLAVDALSEHGIGISKSGIDKRFNNHTLDFLEGMLKKLLKVKLGQQIEAGWLSAFNRVVIKDGTRFDLPEEYHEHLAGAGGSGSKAAACLQFEYDLKGGSILDLTLTSANRPDATDAKEVLDTITENDLVLRDLGYYVFSAFKNIIKKGAYFISRLGFTTIVYEQIQGELQRLDFKALYTYMKQRQLVRLQKQVWIGAKEMISVRLVIELLPEAIYEQRMRKVKDKHRRKKNKTSTEYKEKARFNLFITNVPEETLPAEVVSQLYKIRWQVELVFKIWKSIMGIHNNRRMKYIRWLCQLRFKLLLMVINWNIIMVQRNDLYRKGQLLSLNKCFKTLFDNTLRLRAAIKQGEPGIANFIQWAGKILTQNHWLERKNKSKGLEEIFYL